MPLLHLRSLCTIASALAVLGFAACKSTGAGRGGGGADGDYVNGTPLGTPLPERQEGVSFLGGNVDRSQFPPVYFGFDSSKLAAGEQAKLQAIADFAKGGGATIIIAGFTDERGTPEYNRGLGERRALTVREDLIALGVSAGHLQTVSFGEDMPADSGGGESAWAKNRRAEFGVVR
jgi:peptidoglycan-associated lipoprotein